jgi:hypothetical protein
LHYIYRRVLVDAIVHFEHEKVINCDFKPGSVERSIDLGRGHTLAGSYLNSRQPIEMGSGENLHAIFPYSAANENRKTVIVVKLDFATNIKERRVII